MATNITGAFIDQWNDEVHHLYQQGGSKLREFVRSVSGVVGSTHKFHRLGAVTANTKTRDADVTPLNPAQDVKTATLTDAYAAIYLDKLDLVKTNADFRRENVQVSANALGRKTDDLIIDAMAVAAGQVTIPTVAGGLSLAKLNEARELLDEQDVPPEDRCIVVSPKAITDVLAIEQLTSADYQSMRNLVNGSIDSALGFKWIMSTRLPVNLAIRDCFVFHRNAVGLAIGQDVTTEANYVAEKVSYLVNSYLSMGAVRVEDAGCILIQVDET